MSELRRTLLEDAFYPPHDPRKASPTYTATHHRLVVEMDEPCWVCGIRHSDAVKITDVAEQRKWQLETHHAELEWAAEAAFDTDHPQNSYAAEMLARLTADHAEIMADPVNLREWLDSEGNMLILCATHHRGAGTGVHAITYPVWKLQRYQVSGGFLFVKPPERPT